MAFSNCRILLANCKIIKMIHNLTHKGKNYPWNLNQYLHKYVNILYIDNNWPFCPDFALFNGIQEVNYMPNNIDELEERNKTTHFLWQFFFISCSNWFSWNRDSIKLLTFVFTWKAFERRSLVILGFDPNTTFAIVITPGFWLLKPAIATTLVCPMFC